MEFKFNHVEEMLNKYPNSYLYFGPWWWKFKEMARESGVPVGSSDEPETTKVMIESLDVDNPSDEDILDVILKEYKINLGQWVSGHNHSLPDGTPYRLEDNNVLY